VSINGVAYAPTYTFALLYQTSNVACEYTAPAASYSLRVGETLSVAYAQVSDGNSGDVLTSNSALSSANGASTAWITDTGSSFEFAPTDNAHADLYTLTFQTTDNNSVADAVTGQLTCSYTITVTVLWLNACPTFSAPYTEAETFYRSFNELLSVDTEVTDSDDTDWTRNAQINIAGVISNSCASSPNCDAQLTGCDFFSSIEETLAITITRSDEGANGQDDACTITKTLALVVQDGNKTPVV